MSRKRAARGQDAYAQAVIGDGAIAYWRLDETHGTRALDIVGGYTGTISGGVTLGQPGAVAGNAAMAFDGIQANATGISIPHGAYAVLGPGPLTIEYWLKTPRAAPPDWSVVLVVSSVEVWLSDTQVYHAVRKLDDSLCEFYYPETPSYFDGAWHHYALVVARDGSNNGTLQSYRDGVSIGASLTPLLPIDPKPTVYGNSGLMGMDFEDGNGFYSGAYGLLDDVAIYPTALTPTQIAAHYAAAQPPPPPVTLDSSAIVNALIAKLGADSTLLGYVPNGVYEDLAPPDSTRFVIVSQILATDTLTLVTGRTIEDVYCLVEARMLSSSRGDVRAAALRIDELLENGSLDLPDPFRLMELTRAEFTRSTEVDEVDPTIVWRRRGGRYRVRVSHDQG